MKAKKFTPAMRGLAALMTCLMVLSIVGTGVANTYRGALDDTLGTESYVTINDDSAARFKTDYATIEDMAAAARDIAIREGEEGTVVMKNDNGVLPLKANANVALFGLAAYNVYGPKGGNADAASLADALAGAGLNVNETLKDYYLTNIINMHTEMRANRWTGKEVPTTVYDHMYVSAPGDWTTYQIAEVPPTEFEALGVPANWKEAIAKDSIGICVFARGAGEGNTYKPGSALNYAGEATGEDPLKLSADELAVVEAAKATCSKVIVLLNTGNNMMIADIAEGGSHEVDGICYIGCPNDYQTIGIANVLTGKVNATGALASAFVRDHQSIPAVQNVGGDYFADYEIVCRNDDPRYPGKEIGNIGTGSFGGADTYNGGMYIVEAEGIYVGYKYYETRYFDAVMGQGNANSAAGATQGSAWNYGDEMLYTFGHGLSYLDYTQTIKSVTVDRSVNGNITAVVEVKNNSNQDGKFLTQLYVQQPYTDYDRTNLVEKSAVMFLNSAKVDVAAGKSKEVTITIPTKYLASYDANNAKTYILDAGDYYFTAAAGAHEAVNNILAAQGKTTADGMDAAGKNAVVSWKLDQLDNTTFAIANNTTVTNVADDADLNYWLPGTVTYLTRQDWNTFPINYNKLNLKIADSPKKDQWIAEMRGETYTISDTGAAAEAVPGPKFTASEIGAEQLNNINDPYWDKLVHAITIDEAVGAVIHGGSRSDTLTNIDNPVVIQNEGPTGISAGYTDEATGKTYKFNVNSQTLLGCSFNPELAYQWGLVEGNSCLWVERYDLWGSGLTLNRTPYNGRNYEYISEDPMLTNVIGREVIQGCSDKGIINGPKHMGFNDQEINRSGVAVFMNEQKARELELRNLQQAFESSGKPASFEGDATKDNTYTSGARGVMTSYNRHGAVAASANVATMVNILQGEWGFHGYNVTDFTGVSLKAAPKESLMAGTTNFCGFGASVDYWNAEALSGDRAMLLAIKNDIHNALYALANSAMLNGVKSTTVVSTVEVMTPWRVAYTACEYAFGALAALSLVFWVVSKATSKGGKKA